MINRQKHFDREFYQDTKTGYWISIDYPRIRAHRWVWFKHFGVIPKGYHVHHRDENKSNNDIGNLLLVNPRQHAKFHISDERKKKSQEHMNKIRPLTKHWHGSVEGLAWHKANGILGWLNKQPMKRSCQVCGTQFQTKVSHQKNCSNACKTQFRRNSEIDVIKSNCEFCDILFKKNKYSHTRFCSKKCAGLFRRKDKQKGPRQEI